MKKLFSIVITILLSYTASAQLDNEHWFAPMVDRVNNPATYQTLYLSTDEATPFTVTIYNNNTIIGTKTISKGNPGKFDLLNRDQIITTSDSNLFTPNSMGIYCKADKKFFANLRFSIYNHGEIITAKGKAGIGTKFYAAMAPITLSSSGILNFMTSVLATEDNTQVTISGYSNNVQFSNGTSPTTITFTLNKGQSYIVEGKGNVSANSDAFIGAKIEANKPICVTNGNFNGQYAGNFPSSSDILMDQSVPVDKLGNEFALVKGNGNIGNNMEGAIVIATENNTQVFLNNDVSSIITLQEGDYYRVPETNYINQGNGHYNLYIKTSKNVYVYQLMAGNSGSSTVATGGFNYIPPLNCYLPKKIDEIGLIDENYVVSNNNPGGILNIPTKLNVITEKGAVISVNGNSPTATNGPFNLSGTNNWVSYSFPNVSGNVTINSTKATTAGISAGSDAVGYGGYFAGFSSIPLVTKVAGTCIPGVVLEVPSGYDSYEWYEENNPSVILSTTNTYSPQANGVFYVKVKTGSCVAVSTPFFTDQFCLLTNSVASYNVCKTQIKITPQFSVYSDAISPSSVNIVTPPTKGTISINSTTGEITYTLNAGQTGADVFVYNFSNGQPIPKYETVTVSLNLVNLKVNDATLKACKINGQGTFDLSLANLTSNTYSSIKYFPTLADATANNLSSEILNVTSYTTSTEKAIYAKVYTTEGCEDIAKINLQFYAVPNVDLSAYNTTPCDEEVDGVIHVNFTTVSQTIVSNYSEFTLKYYLSSSDASAGNSNVLPNNWTYNTDTTVYVRIESPDGCPPLIFSLTFGFGPKVTLSNNTIAATVCDDDLNGNQNINLADYISLFTNDNTVSVAFYNSLAEAQNQANPINSNQVINANKSFFIRFSKNGVCPNIAEINLSFNQPIPSSLLPNSLVICQGTTTTLDPGNIYSNFLWSTGETSQTINAAAGNYWVEITAPNGCVYKQYITITETPKPIWNIAAFNATICDDNVDGSIPVDFSAITPIIITNANLFNIKYYTSAADATAGNNNTLPNNWSFSANTTVFVRAESSICPPEINPITFIIGPKVTLSNNTIAATVCDDDLNGNQNINLADYISLFTNDNTVSVAFYNSLAEAQNQANPINSNQVINANKSFFIRFSKNGVCPNIAEINLSFNQPIPSSLLPNSLVICQGTTTTLDPGNIYSNFLWSTGETSQTINAAAGNYWVEITAPNGCVYKQYITITETPKPIWNIAAFNATICDDNVDGSIPVDFSAITPIIITNANLFNIKYYTSAADATAGNNNTLPNNWSFSANTTVFVRAESSICPPEINPITFIIGPKVTLATASYTDVLCDNNLDASETVDLNRYKTYFTSNNNVAITYYTSLVNAQNKSNPISNVVNLGLVPSQYFVRFEEANACPNIAQIQLSINQPRVSSVLEDQEICSNAFTTVDAGAGFNAYLWSNGSTNSSTVYGIGNHYVDLYSNGCVYRQNFRITAFSSPVISDIIIVGNKITINATGGHPPYQYSLDGLVYQSSPVFNSVPRGTQTVFVMDSKLCQPVTQEVFIINLMNVITPNGDGLNDVLDYSELTSKNEVKMEIYDRFGNRVAKEIDASQYRWDGKIKGRVVSTGTYWYVLEWTEPTTGIRVSYHGWVLVKNRN